MDTDQHGSRRSAGFSPLQRPPTSIATVLKRTEGFVITHILGRMCEQSQRDCVRQPRVARHELPWDSRKKPRQPQRGCGWFGHEEAATPLGLAEFQTTFTQGSFPHRGTTLGFEPESLWDSS